MNYSLIRTCDMANGTGFRISLFVSGCPHHCPECFNKETWDFNYGDKFTEETSDYLLKEIGKSYISGFSLLGGEPLAPTNQLELVTLLEKIKTKYPDKDIWCYTGYTYETIPKINITDDLLSNIDILVDGPFIEEEKDITLKFRGSRNQRIIDLKSTLKEGQIILLDI